MPRIEVSYGHGGEDYIEYVNTGDSYALTVVYDSLTDDNITSWGDIVEKQMKRFSDGRRGAGRTMADS